MAKRLDYQQVSDHFWEIVSPLIPKPTRKPDREYKRKLGGGRKPLDPRKVFEAIVYVLRTGIPWKALPKEIYGSPSSIHAYFQMWEKAGFFDALWQKGFAEYDDLAGIAWHWQITDRALVKATLAPKACGPIPTDQGEKRQQAPSLHPRAWRPVIGRRDRSQQS